MSIKLVAAGAPCTCHPDRVVRTVIPPVPGIPRGEVSCRPAGESVKYADVRRHPLAAGATVAVRVPIGAR